MNVKITHYQIIDGVVFYTFLTTQNQVQFYLSNLRFHQLFALHEQLVQVKKKIPKILQQEKYNLEISLKKSQNQTPQHKEQLLNLNPEHKPVKLILAFDLPEFPKKKWFGNKSDEFIKHRADQLQKYFSELSSQVKNLYKQEQFLQKQNDFSHKIYAFIYLQINKIVNNFLVKNSKKVEDFDDFRDQQNEQQIRIAGGSLENQFKNNDWQDFIKDIQEQEKKQKQKLKDIQHNNKNPNLNQAIVSSCPIDQQQKMLFEEGNTNNYQTYMPNAIPVGAPKDLEDEKQNSLKQFYEKQKTGSYSSPSYLSDVNEIQEIDEYLEDDNDENLVKVINTDKKPKKKSSQNNHTRKSHKNSKKSDNQSHEANIKQQNNQQQQQQESSEKKHKSSQNQIFKQRRKKYSKSNEQDMISNQDLNNLLNSNSNSDEFRKNKSLSLSDYCSDSDDFDDFNQKSNNNVKKQRDYKKVNFLYEGAQSQHNRNQDNADKKKNFNKHLLNIPKTNELLAKLALAEKNRESDTKITFDLDDTDNATTEGRISTAILTPTSKSKSRQQSTVQNAQFQAIQKQIISPTFSHSSAKTQLVNNQISQKQNNQTNINVNKNNDYNNNNNDNQGDNIQQQKVLIPNQEFLKLQEQEKNLSDFQQKCQQELQAQQIYNFPSVYEHENENQI
ncbi:Phox homologous domain [Pseudocohnilembus persalinus]|uniref:Phox homologous domain n=1 Tax=Pseudocohnilembus persalinus TaxID=266149 RepID=A0A0V0QVV9_PSEPJ|nr:Phox homologous domain [Pseudocohnilembus persalinus]|eukprot:KRX06321.1 Phox homologous domain [Pseudocohnilembus persalinus]